MKTIWGSQAQRSMDRTFCAHRDKRMLLIGAKKIQLVRKDTSGTNPMGTISGYSGSSPDIVEGNER